MLNPISVRRILVLSCACVASLVLSVASTAQTPDLLAPEPALEELVAFTFEGSVHAPDGTPAEGAIVVSAAGGQAVTDREGNFRLEVRVPPEAESVRVTAVGGSNGKLLASQQVQISGASGSISVPSMQLAQSNTCHPSWLPTFGAVPGTDDEILAVSVFDDGGGSALYVGGKFIVAGSTLAPGIAKWDGTSWSSLGTGMGGDTVFALAVYNDGNGERLYAGGDFTEAGGVVAEYVASWDGTTWSPLGTGRYDTVFSLEVFDDGNGAGLYAGSDWVPGASTARVIARWDGSDWTALGTGMNGPVYSMTVFDDGSGSELYAGGRFGFAGGTPASRIAKWNGASWAALGTGMNSAVLALTAFNDGTGPALYAGGEFTTAGGVAANHIAKWDGSSWTSLGAGLDASVSALSVFDSGSGAALIVGGEFTMAGGAGASSIASWDGSSWSVVGGGTNLAVRSLVVFDDGSGDELFAGGSFLTAGGVGARRAAKWNGSNWSTFGSGVSDQVLALAVFDDGSGDALFAGGYFQSAGGVVTNGIGKWDGSNWTSVGGGVLGGLSGQVRALVAFDDGNGERLIAGGDFQTAGGIPTSNIAQWDGSNWSALGSGIDFFGVHSLTVFDDGSGDRLIAGGWFNTAGGVSASGVAQWDGTSWSSLGLGIDGIAYAMELFDAGSGLELIVGGQFTNAGGAPASRIAKWDGSSWSPLGSGAFGTVRALTVFDGGGGPELIAGGDFPSVDGVAASKIAKWDGASWSPLGSGVNILGVYALTVFDDGSGPALVVGGNFNLAGGTTAFSIAEWNGSDWAALGGGVINWVQALSAFDDGGGEALYVGGQFARAPDSGDSFLAKWGCAPILVNDFCNGDGGDQLGCTDCPCGNNAPAGTIGGCLNSVQTSARLIASGSSSVSLSINSSNDLRFGLIGAPPNAFCTLNSGDAVAPNNAANPCFGLGSGVRAMQFDGLRCAVVNTRRHGGRGADANGSVGESSPAWGGSDNPPIGIAQAGGGFAAGQTRYFQVIHREESLLSCMRGLNTSQAIEITFIP